MTTLEYEVIPSKHWVEGDEEGWSYPELFCTGKVDGKPVRLRVPMCDTEPPTVDLAKQLIHNHIQTQGG